MHNASFSTRGYINIVLETGAFVKFRMQWPWFFSIDTADLIFEKKLSGLEERLKVKLKTMLILDCYSNDSEDRPH